MRKIDPPSGPSPARSLPRRVMSRLAAFMTMRTLLIVATLVAFAGLAAACRWAPRHLLAHIVIVDAKRLALGWVRDLDGAFDLPGRPAALGRIETMSYDWLLGPQRREGARFDLFDTARFASRATGQSIAGYAVFTRFGDRLLSAGKPLFRDMGQAAAATRFAAARDGAVRAYRKGAMDEAGVVTISVVVPLLEGADFAGAIMLDVRRNGVEPGILSGIERSIFALVALVLSIAFVLLLLLSILRARSLRIQRRAAYLARFDPLTGLHNRESFLQLLGERVAAGRERKRNFAVVLIDLRRFAWVNDTFGEDVGDELLKAFGGRLDRKLRVDPEFAQCGAVAARLGADEFAALFACDTRAQLERVCEALAAISGESVDIGGVRVDVTAAFGAALFPFDGETMAELQASVRYALETAKGSKSDGHVQLFDTEIAARHRRWRKLLADIETALTDGQMALHYQPQVSVAGGPALTGFEALMRWNHPQEGAVSPGEFIPLAERSGIIRELGTWCLREACREAARWGGADAPTIAVNVSPAQFVGEGSGEGLVGIVERVLDETGLPPARLELEITEGLLLGETGANRDILTGLNALGVRLALDDFGTGYSSLSYLSRIPVDKVKLDRSFVLRLADDAKLRAIVGAVAAMCEALGMTLLAEGVETLDEQQLLVTLGCRHIQGYLHGRPTREPSFALSAAPPLAA